MDRNLLSIHAFPKRMIFCISLLLIAQGIFPKSWPISFFKKNESQGAGSQGQFLYGSDTSMRLVGMVLDQFIGFFR